MPLLAYTLSVSQEPEVTTVSSALGSGTLKSIVEAVSAGTFSSPPDVAPPVPPLSSVPPVPPLDLAVSSFLPSPAEDFAYQTPPPTIRATATSAETMITSEVFGFRPPPPGCPGCGCIGMLG